MSAKEIYNARTTAKKVSRPKRVAMDEAHKVFLQIKKHFASGKEKVEAMGTVSARERASLLQKGKQCLCGKIFLSPTFLPPLYQIAIP